MKILKALDENFEKVVCAILMSIMTFVITAQIILRVFGAPLSWTEEIARYLFVWLIYIACALAVKQRKHVKVEAVLLLFKERGQFVLTIVSDILFLVFVIIVAKYGLAVVLTKMIDKPQFSASLQLPMWIPYAAIFVGPVLMIIRLIQDIYWLFVERKAVKEGKTIQRNSVGTDDPSTMV